MCVLLMGGASWHHFHTFSNTHTHTIRLHDTRGMKSTRGGVPVLTLLLPVVSFVEGVFSWVVGHGELVQQRHDDLSRKTCQMSP